MKIYLFLFAILAFPALLFATGSSESDYYQGGTSQQSYQGSTHVVIPYGVTVVDRDSGLQDKGLSIITIPSSVIQIGNYAFSGNVLSSVTIPDSVTSIGERAFNNNRLTSVFIGKSVTSIGVSAFRNNRLTSITIPDSVTTIGSWAFYDNPDLKSITIGANVKMDYYQDAIPCTNFYIDGGRRAGTYSSDGRNWTYSPRR